MVYDRGNGRREIEDASRGQTVEDGKKVGKIHGWQKVEANGGGGRSWGLRIAGGSYEQDLEGMNGKWGIRGEIEKDTGGWREVTG